MRCSRCGTQNDQDASYCKECGAKLLSRTLRDERRVAVADNVSANFEDAFYQVLETEGTRILRSPKRLLGLVSDLCDQSSSEFRVFEYNCNSELLSPFVEAVEKGLDSAGLDAATNRAIFALEDRSIEAKRAATTAIDIRNALARYAGLEVYVPAAESEPEGDDEHTPERLAQTARRPRAEAAKQGQGRENSARYAEEDKPSKAQGSVTSGSQQSGAQGMSGQAPVRPVPTQPAMNQQPVQSQQKGMTGFLVALMVVLVIAIGAVSYGLINKQGGGAKQAVAATISFSGGSGAKGTMQSVEVERGESFTVPKCGYTRAGYEFAYWKDQSNKKYDPGDPLTARDDVELTANWEKLDDTSGEEESDDSLPAEEDYGATDAEPKVVYTEPETRQPDESNSNASSSTDANSNSSFSSNSNSNASNSASRASSFPRIWSGSYQGDYNDTPIRRQLLFEFTEVSDSGELKGACYTGVIDGGPGATYGSCNVEGTIDWNNGVMHLWQTSWIDQGGLGPEREYQATVDFSAQTMSGSLATKGTGIFDVPWSASAAESLDWNTNA